MDTKYSFLTSKASRRFALVVVALIAAGVLISTYRFMISMIGNNLHPQTGAPTTGQTNLSDDAKRALLNQLSQSSPARQLGSSQKAEVLKKLSQERSIASTTPLTPEEKMRLLNSLH